MTGLSGTPHASHGFTENHEKLWCLQAVVEPRAAESESVGVNDFERSRSRSQFNLVDSGSDFSTKQILINTCISVRIRLQFRWTSPHWGSGWLHKYLWRTAELSSKYTLPCDYLCLTTYIFIIKASEGEVGLSRTRSRSQCHFWKPGVWVGVD